VKMTFDENLTPVFDGVAKADADPDTVDLAQRGVLSGFGGIKFGNIPVGDALLGGASATLVSELITGFVGAGVMGALVKLVAGNMLAGAFSGIMGRGATDSARLFITYDAVRDLVPIDQWVGNIMGGVTGAANGNGNNNTVSAAQSAAGVPYTGNGSVVAIDSWLKSAA
jgi:hypothetical protein